MAVAVVATQVPGSCAAPRGRPGTAAVDPARGGGVGGGAARPASNWPRSACPGAALVRDSQHPGKRALAPGSGAGVGQPRNWRCKGARATSRGPHGVGVYNAEAIYRGACRWWAPTRLACARRRRAHHFEAARALHPQSSVVPSVHALRGADGAWAAFSRAHAPLLCARRRHSQAETLRAPGYEWARRTRGGAPYP